jgi:hypothetical protein
MKRIWVVEYDYGPLEREETVVFITNGEKPRRGNSETLCEVEGAVSLKVMWESNNHANIYFVSRVFAADITRLVTKFYGFTFAYYMEERSKGETTWCQYPEEKRTHANESSQ